MKILVTGAGRGGTNLAIELIRNFNHFNVTENVEDRLFFERKVLINKYATKLATENKGFNIDNINRIMIENPDLYVVFVTRNPIDNCLSKILRGRPSSEGGDSTVNSISPDATLEGSVVALKKMYKIYEFLNEYYKDRLISFKMEDLIENTNSVIDLVSKKLKLSKTSNVKNFYKTNRNLYQKKRYNNKLHHQVDLYKDLNTNFEGFFKEKGKYVNYIKNNLSEVIKNLKY